MASKKREGLDGVKVTKGGTRRDDRQITSKTVFDPINITTNNASTVICMLKSPENEILIKALASLDTFASKVEDNLRILTSLEIGSHLLTLIRHNDTLVKRFAQKLIGELSSIQEFREQLLEEENVLDTFMDILETEKDVVMHEYAALALAAFSSDYEAASALLQCDKCVETLFTRITSVDPDVQKNCLEIMNHLLDDVFGIAAFEEASNFEINSLLILTSSNYPAIQILALEVLTKLTSACRESKALFAFRDALGLETVLSILEKSDWKDLHEMALDLMLNVADNLDIVDYLLQSGCLSRIINILDNLDVNAKNERILGVLARMSQTKKGRIALNKLNMVEKFCEYLHDQSEVIQESACLGIANLAQFDPSLESVLEANPIPFLLSLVVGDKNNLTVRNMAAYALNILCNQDSRAGKALLICENFFLLNEILNLNDELPNELCKNVIQIFTGISSDCYLRQEIVDETTVGAILSVLQGKHVYPMKDISLQVDALECLSGLLLEKEAVVAFLDLEGIQILLRCLKSRFASLREWAGHLVVVASYFADFVKVFIIYGGVNWLFNERNSRYSMPSWESALEAIFSKYLPAKFAFTGRLDLHDITEDGFYVLTKQNLKFFLIDYCFEKQCVPLYPVYVVNFNDVHDKSSSSISENQAEENRENSGEKKNQKKHIYSLESRAERNLNDVFSKITSANSIMTINTEKDLSFISEKFKYFIPDLYLSDYLENLKKRIAKKETAIGDASWRCVHPVLIEERAKIIAEFVAEEMAGTNPNMICSNEEKEKHISELKFQLGTNIIPLGLIKTGSFLERALLFKVLADRVGFPCALVRNNYGKTWIEIAIPTINVDNPTLLRESTAVSMATSSAKSSSRRTTLNSELHANTHANFFGESDIDTQFWFSKLRTEYYKGLPSSCLKTNALVDLVNEPGKIMKLNSFEAEEYLGIVRSY